MTFSAIYGYVDKMQEDRFYHLDVIPFFNHKDVLDFEVIGYSPFEGKSITVKKVGNTIELIKGCGTLVWHNVTGTLNACAFVDAIGSLYAVLDVEEVSVSIGTLTIELPNPLITVLSPIEIET